MEKGTQCEKRSTGRTWTCDDTVEGATAVTTRGCNPAKVWWPRESCAGRLHSCVSTARKTMRARTVCAQSDQATVMRKTHVSLTGC